jgi:hypothetical protein
VSGGHFREARRFRGQNGKNLPPVLSSHVPRSSPPLPSPPSLATVHPRATGPWRRRRGIRSGDSTKAPRSPTPAPVLLSRRFASARSGCGWQVDIIERTGAGGGPRVLARELRPRARESHDSERARWPKIPRCGWSIASVDGDGYRCWMLFFLFFIFFNERAQGVPISFH